MKKFTKRLLLAAVGAAAMTKAESRKFFKDMKKQGITEKEGKRYLKQLLLDVQKSSNELVAQMNKRVNAIVGNLDVGKKGGSTMKRRTSRTSRAKRTVKAKFRKVKRRIGR